MPNMDFRGDSTHTQIAAGIYHIAMHTEAFQFKARDIHSVSLRDAAEVDHRRLAKSHFVIRHQLNASVSVGYQLGQ